MPNNYEYYKVSKNGKEFIQISIEEYAKSMNMTIDEVRAASLENHEKAMARLSGSVDYNED